MIISLLTGSEAHDCRVAKRLGESSHEMHVGDKAYDSADLREELNWHGTRPLIPNRATGSSRSATAL
jgi:IS5 family transposase